MAKNQKPQKNKDQYSGIDKIILEKQEKRAKNKLQDWKERLMRLKDNAFSYEMWKKDNRKAIEFWNTIEDFIKEIIQAEKEKVIKEIEKDLAWFEGKDSTAPKVIDKWIELKKKYEE